jgi:formylglycine-generating enzyme required for sulfatase activity/flavodoxin
MTALTFARILAAALAVFMLEALGACGAAAENGSNAGQAGNAPKEAEKVKTPDSFVLIKGGTFQMGSPDSEPWRGKDERLHAVTVSDFRLDSREVTQADYKAVMGRNPSVFTGDGLPVENISWLDAIAYCNAKSERDGLTPAYAIDGSTITWNRGADGYRLPTEAEWEYACRAGTNTPFNTQGSIDPKEANYYGHYPYQIEENYFDQGKLETKPGEYRHSTTEVGAFPPNRLGLHDMHGNVGEWVWDHYGEYGQEAQTDPTGPSSGTLRVYRGGGWNDFAKNLRSAYRAALPADKAQPNLGLRLARNAAAGSGSVTVTAAAPKGAPEGGKALIVFYSWSGNTKRIAEEIRRQTGADLYEIKPSKPYSSNYSTVLEEAQRDQNRQARPAIAGAPESIGEYSVVLLGYPNWWASIPMPIAAFLEKYDFSGKRIIPFCSHGGGRFGQSLTAISKLAPDAAMGDALSVGSSGGSGLASDVAKWLKSNGVQTTQKGQ